jgi:hypothetical protein
VKYKLTALYADGITPLGYSEFPVFAVDRTIVVRLPEESLATVDMEAEYKAVQSAFPDRFVLLTSAGVEFLVLEPVDDDPSLGVSLEGASWAAESVRTP